jgi:hypothetical protein
VVVPGAVVVTNGLAEHLAVLVVGVFDHQLPLLQRHSQLLPLLHVQGTPEAPAELAHSLELPALVHRVAPRLAQHVLRTDEDPLTPQPQHLDQILGLQNVLQADLPAPRGGVLVERVDPFKPRLGQAYF